LASSFAGAGAGAFSSYGGGGASSTFGALTSSPLLLPPLHFGATGWQQLELFREQPNRSSFGNCSFGSSSFGSENRPQDRCGWQHLGAGLQHDGAGLQHELVW